MHQLKQIVRVDQNNMNQLYVAKKNLNPFKKYNDSYRLIINEWRKIYYANTNQKQAGVAVLSSDRAHVKTRKVIRDKEAHYIMIKWSAL